MPKYISIEKRNDIILNKQKGKTPKEIADFLNISVVSVSRIWRQFETTNSVESKVANCGRKSVISEEQKIALVEQLDTIPDMTLNERIEKLNLNITESGLSKYLSKFSYTFKKKYIPCRTRQARCSRKT